ncbi:MAG: hypothetical protein QY323_00820 [Patescibacteria group bacterium]|nr:MAG: hypothetical protein QY323_00820 [Patescibacteria group bacterium]
MPHLFTLMAKLTAEERQKLGERRRELKARDGVQERLVEARKGEWQLEYWRAKEKIETIPLL